MKFKDFDEVQEYIEMNSRTVTRELPYCAFCDNVIDCDSIALVLLLNVFSIVVLNSLIYIPPPFK